MRFWIPTWSTQRQHLRATSLPHDLNRLRIKALFALLCPLERHGHERVDHGALQRDRGLQESRCRVWCAEDRREHRSGSRGEALGLKAGDLSASSVADAGEVSTLDHLGVVISLSTSNACALLSDTLRECVLDLGVRLLLAPLEVLLLEPGDNRCKPCAKFDRISDMTNVY